MKTTSIKFTEVVRHYFEMWARTDSNPEYWDMYDRFAKGGEQAVNIDDVNELLSWLDFQLNDTNVDHHFNRQELYSIREMHKRASEALKRLQE